LISGKTIFISPLDWGLGHATRCVPIILSLMEKNKIFIGVTNLNTHFFSEQFPEVEKVELPSYKISYSKYLPLWLKLVMQWPAIKSVIRKEKKMLAETITKYKIDLVISDSRYGLSNKDVHCIFITHQLNLKTPFFFDIANRVNRKYIHRFNEVWVPDYENENLRLSGQLSDSGLINIPVKYIGPKSALQNQFTDQTLLKKYDILILISGVEPQRTLLEEKLMERFVDSGKKIVLVRGTRTEAPLKNENVKIIDFASGAELKELIVNAGTVICRSGYSTLMDLHLLDKKKLILIPTPGQREQEYLASYWSKKFNALEVPQNKIRNFDPDRI